MYSSWEGVAPSLVVSYPIANIITTIMIIPFVQFFSLIKEFQYYNWRAKQASYIIVDSMAQAVHTYM